MADMEKEIKTETVGCEIPIWQLWFSTRTCNALLRMGIYSAEDLRKTPIEYIAKQRNIGVKTLEEIVSVSETLGDNVEQLKKTTTLEARVWNTFSDEQLFEMSQYSIHELKLSMRPYNALKRKNYVTLDKIAILTTKDLAQMDGIGSNSIDEIQNAVFLWVQDHFGLQEDSLEVHIDGFLRKLLENAVNELKPIFYIHWTAVYKLLVQAGAIETLRSKSHDGLLRTILELPDIRKRIKKFWDLIAVNGVISVSTLTEKLESLELVFNPEILVDVSFNTQILTLQRDIFLIARDTFLETYDKICNPDDRVGQILQFRVEGERLQSIGDLYGLTRERVRQIVAKEISKFPLVYEDYFSEPYQYFSMSKEQFIRAFPEVSEEGFGFLAIRYKKGINKVNEEAVNRYNGLWKERLSDFLDEENELDDRRTISKAKLAMRVLLDNLDRPLTLAEFEFAYHNYMHTRGYPEKRLKFNVCTIKNVLRSTEHIVFNRENKVRYCAVESNEVWNNICFSQYKNKVISCELIFRDYRDLMDDLDIRDGYELFYVIKNSLSVWDGQFSIRCRRVPTIILGDASEENQAVQLLKEISPINFADYYEAYEKRYGVWRNSAQGNSAIFETLQIYYTNGQYVIDVPTINKADVRSLCVALRQRPIWFIEDLEELVDEVCVYSTRECINRAAFKRIGYALHNDYVYDESYGTSSDLLNQIVFSKDIVDLNFLDRRLTNLPVFTSLLDKKKNALEYIEINPKILMSCGKVREVYNLSLEDIQAIQLRTIQYNEDTYFNGRTLWEKIKEMPAVQKLHGNDWMLTCIMRQQSSVASLRVKGGIILSLDSSLLNLGRICEWLVSLSGPMSINTLARVFNDTFGTSITSWKIAEKIRTSGLWDKIVTDSVEVYINELVDMNIIDKTF